MKLLPHRPAPDFPDRDDAGAGRIAARSDFPLSGIDDDPAIRVQDDRVEVISEGRWPRRP